MDILMWLINLCSFFSCFGAIIVLIFMVRKNKEVKYWKLLGIISIYVFSYASGIIYLIFNFGFTVPDMQAIGIIPAAPSFGYFLGSFLNLVQLWLIISAAGEFFNFQVKLSYIVFIPAAVAAFIIPDSLLIINRELLFKTGNVFIIIRLALGYIMMEHIMVAALIQRKLWYKRSRLWLMIMTIIFSLFVIPSMFVEDLFTLYRGMLAYNIYEAVGFFLLMTTVMVAGIIKLSSASDKTDTRMSLLDVSRVYGLTEREMDVLKELVASSSVSYKDIAAKLNISPETVKTHVSRIYRKLGVSAKQELKYKIGNISG